MKILLLLALFFTTSCASMKRPLVTDKAIKCIDPAFTQKIVNCMFKFAQQGYDSQAVVTICKAAYEKRK